MADENRCPNCSNPTQAGWKFCPSCKTPLSKTAARDGAPGWTDEKDVVCRTFEVAGSIDVEELENQLLNMAVGVVQASNFIVPHGFRGVAMLDGRLAQTLEPGRHKLTTLWQALTGRGPQSVRVHLVRVTDLELVFEIDEIRAADDVPFAINSRIVVRVDDAPRFVENMPTGKGIFPVARLRSALYDELHNALTESLAAFEADKLRGDVDTKRRLTTDVENHLRRTLTRNGLHLVYYRTIEFGQQGLDAARDVRGAARVQEHQLDAEQASIATDERGVDVRLERIALLQRMREAVNTDEMNSVRTGEQLADFMHEIDKGRLLRDNEMMEFRRAFEEKKGDHEGQRAHLLDKLDVERKHEIDSLRQDHRHELLDRNLDKEFDRESKRLDQRLKREAAEREHERTQDVADVETKVGREERLLDLRRKKEEMENELGRALDQREQERLQAEHDREQSRRQSDHDRRMDELERQSRAAREEVEAFRDFTTDQIAAIQAAKSPELAKALQAKFAAEAEAARAVTDRERKLYEDMVAQSQKQIETIKEFGTDALRAQAETARGAAGVRRASGFGVTDEPTAIQCPKCRYRVDADLQARNCPNCGTDL